MKLNDEPQSSGKSIKVPFNIINSTIETQLPILTDLSPSFSVEPREPSDFEFADVISKVIKDWWHRNGLDQTLVSTLKDMLTLGTGIQKVVWNSELNDGTGEVEVKQINPEDIWVNDEATDFGQEKGCRWVVEKITKTVGEWRALFPEKADEIHADSDKDNKKEDTTILQSPVDQVSRFEHQGELMGTNDLAEALEMWMFDETLEAFEEEMEDGTRQKMVKKKFPNGRRILVLHKQNIELVDDSNPFRDGMFPYVRYIDLPIPRKFWGQGEAEILFELQKLLNKISNSIANYINMSGNPVWMLPKSSGILPKMITNQMGMILSYNDKDGQAPKRDTPSPLYCVNIRVSTGYWSGLWRRCAYWRLCLRLRLFCPCSHCLHESLHCFLHRWVPLFLLC